MDILSKYSFFVKYVTIAIVVPLNIILSATAWATTLMWDLSQDPTVVGYMVYEGPASNSYTTKTNVGSAGSYVLSNLADGATYYFAVTAYDAKGAESIFSNEVSTTVPYTAPVAAFAASATTGMAPLALNFNNSSTGTVTADAWTFGDGGTSTAQNPAHVYAAAGVYTVSLQVTGPGGSNTMTRSSYITVTSGAPDTTPPTVPSNVRATAAGSTGINLSWTSSTDSVGVTGYRVERCQGAGCTTFAQIATPAGTAYSDSGLAASTSYTYRVRATDAAGNLSPYSASATVITGAASAAIAFVQQNSATPQSPQSSVPVTFTGAQTAGNLNVVVVGWNDSTAAVKAVTDSRGNVYTRAVGPTVVDGLLGQSIYYAKNIAGASANTNTVTVQFSVAAQYPDIRVLEYSGLDPVNPVDVVAAGAGYGAASSTPAVPTTHANDLIFGASTVRSGNTGPGAGFTSRVITIPDGDIAEDRTVTSVGSYSATAPMTDGIWVMQMVAFRGGGGAVDKTPPTTPSNLLATAVGSSGINVTWTAATDNIGVTGYRVERCKGMLRCKSFAQIATSTGTAYSDTGLAASTRYSYRVRAIDAAGNLSPYSATATVITGAAGAPIAFVQQNSATPQSPQSSVPVTFTGAQTAGNLNVVVVGWNDSAAAVNAVTDSRGNVYTRAVGPTVVAGLLGQSIYYAKNIAGASANTNMVTVQFSVAAQYPDIRVLEYSGLDPVNPVDVVAAGAGYGAASSTPAVPTTHANDLIFGASTVRSGNTGPGAGFTSRVITIPDGDIAEDRTVTSVGSYSATAPMTDGNWVMQMVALRGAP